MKPIRDLDWGRLIREVKGATDVERQRFRDPTIHDTLLATPDTREALQTMFFQLGLELGARSRAGQPLDDQPVVRALARLLAHPQMPAIAALPDRAADGANDLMPWLRARAEALALAWDQAAFQQDIVDHLTTIHGDIAVDDGRAPWMKYWAAASPAAVGLILAVALAKLGRLT